MFKKILIANRGEIALRVIRACRELGITAVAIYSEADRDALHVKQADESYCLGPESLAAYLNSHRIVTLAKSCQCDAIHPGYGFLSENADFARLCAKEGVCFIGPNPDVIELMGDKVKARHLMQAAKIPVVPGSPDNLTSLDEVLAMAEEIGYPVMLKASTGGGGRGLRRCDNAKQCQQNYERVISEATKSFASPEIFMEKYIENARHIEVQILADQHGQVIHAYERDCSIQRRHQKLIEVAPSPQLNSRQRQEVTSLAVRAAQYAQYDHIGTVEFVMDGEDFYFLEMNTRLQVEHPITEMITGIDIVAEQIRLAAGKPLSYQQRDIQFRGVAIECRINAEDPKNEFLPSFGKITRYYAPGGPGVRTDSAVYTGYTIPSDYDSMCVKLVVWHDDWLQAINRTLRALSEMRLYGIKTTIPYYLAILNDAQFQQADFSTLFVEQRRDLLEYDLHKTPRQLATAIASALAVYFDYSRSQA